jgi:hypothetical protein
VVPSRHAACGSRARCRAGTQPTRHGRTASKTVRGTGRGAGRGGGVAREPLSGLPGLRLHLLVGRAVTFVGGLVPGIGEVVALVGGPLPRVGSAWASSRAAAPWASQAWAACNAAPACARLAPQPLPGGHCCIERSPRATASTSPLKDDRSWARSSGSTLSRRPSMKESLHFARLPGTFRLNATVPPRTRARRRRRRRRRGRSRRRPPRTAIGRSTWWPRRRRAVRAWPGR